MLFIIIFVFPNLFCQAQWTKQNANTDASFRSIHAVSKQIVWAGGSKGTVLRTINGGKNWEVLRVKDAEKLDFRDIYAIDAQKAYIMSAGDAAEGAAKIFKTIDGGKTWTTSLHLTEKGIFFDSMDFWNEKEGILIGDPIDDKPFIMRTLDGGISWQRIDKNQLPTIQVGEASFAASGTCAVVKPQGKAWLNTQNRVFRTSNKGETWEVSETPFQKGETAGIFGLHFSSEKQGFAVGGDYKNDKVESHNITQTIDGGKTWQFLPDAKPNGLKEAAWLLPSKQLLLVGTSGTSLSNKDFSTWQAIDTASFHSLSCYKNVCWAIGSKGNLAKWIK